MLDHKTVSLADQVYDALEADILSGKYARGDILTENKLCEVMGVSRTPVREALRRLGQENLIRDGAKGSVVYDFEHGDVYESGEPEKVKVVSTVGAGDCYSASFVHSYLTGASIPEAIRTTSRRSNIVVSHTEAIPKELI